jgi:hypothetical protein
MWVCAVMAAVALGTVLASGNAIPLLGVIGCVVMMAMMMLMMGGIGDRSGPNR